MRMLAPLAVLAAGLSAGLAPAGPAAAVGGISTYMTYASAPDGSVVFTCHATATSGPITARIADWTMVSCTVNGTRSVVHHHDRGHAHGVGVATAPLGSAATFCVDGSAVYGLFPPLSVRHTACTTVTIAPVGVVVV